MRLARLDARAFGALSGRSFELEPAVALVVGPNEAGKSTFLAAVETVFYGFEPAKREDHALVRFQGPEAPNLLLEASFTFESRAGLRVERVLLSRGTLRLAEEGEDFEGKREGNRPLAEVGGLPRRVFRSVYALTAADLVELEGSVRSHVDELLLGERLLPELRPIFQVRAELAEDRKKLWRPDRKGKPRAAQLRTAIGEARKRLGEALANERELRDARREKEELEEGLERLRKKRRSLERTEADAAFLSDLFALRRLERRLERLDLGELAGGRLEDPAALTDDVRALEERLAEPEARLGRPLLVVDRARARLLERAPAVDELRTTQARCDADRQRLAELVQRGRAAEAEATRELARLAGHEPTRADLDRLASFPLEALRAARATWEANAGDPPTKRGAAVVLAGSGIVLAAIGASGVGPPAVGGAGAVLLVLAWITAVRRGTDDRTRSAARSADADRLLAGFGLDPALASTPQALERAIDRLDQMLSKIDALHGDERRAQELARALAAEEDRGIGLAAELGLDGSSSASEALGRLQQSLAAARRREEEVRRDADERGRAQTLVDALRPQLEQRRAALTLLEETLRTNAPHAPDPSAAYEEVREHLKQRAYLETRSNQLRADGRFERLANHPLLEAPDETDVPWREEARARRADSLRALERTLAESNQRYGELAEQLRHDEGSRGARAKEELAALEAELVAVRRERDRLALAEQVLAEADRRWRDENQPDVLRRAGEYLAGITDGRYTRLDYPEEDGAGLIVSGSRHTEPVPASAPISRGTRDQIYLCLRLALLDHLDEGRPRLPLVLDEALVHWDDDRRRALYPLLARVAEQRQVFVLTCHAHLAQEAEQALGVRAIQLEGQSMSRPVPGASS